MLPTTPTLLFLPSFVFSWVVAIESIRHEAVAMATVAAIQVLSDVASAALRDLGLDNYSDTAVVDPKDKKPINFRPDMEMSETWVIDRS